MESRTGHKIVVTEYGEDPKDAIENFLKVEQMPFPDIETLRSTDVVVKVRASSVGWVDVIMTSGQYQHIAQPPYVPGNEYAGEIAWVGSDVTRYSVGDRVFSDGGVVGTRSYGEYQKYGGFADFAVAPEHGVHPLPDALSFGQGCNILGNYETAYHCLLYRGRLRQNETVLIHGASGSTGLAAVHVAKLTGARVIATGRNDEKLAFVREQGADFTINTSRVDGQLPRFRDQVKELTDGQGVDVVYDGVGGEISLESLRCVKFGARYVIVGWAATPNVSKGKGQRGAPNANMLPTNLIMMKGLDVLGAPAMITAHKFPEVRKERLTKVLQWVQEGAISPYVSDVYPWQDVKKAMLAKWNSQVRGGCVIEFES